MAHHDDEPLIRALIGAGAGLLGTVAIQSIMGARMKFAPGTAPPMRREPGKFMAQRAESVLPPRARQYIPASVENVAGKAMGFGYGMFFGALYALLRPHVRSIVGEGILLGLLCWAAGYLGWLPATGIMPPVWKQNAKQIIPPPIEHALFGVASVAAYDQIAQRV